MGDLLDATSRVGGDEQPENVLLGFIRSDVTSTRKPGERIGDLKLDLEVSDLDRASDILGFEKEVHTSFDPDMKQPPRNRQPDDHNARPAKGDGEWSGRDSHIHIDESVGVNRIKGGVSRCGDG